MDLLPLSNDGNMSMLDDHLMRNESETTKFVAYFKKLKFKEGFKAAFFKLITEKLLLEYNYNGKGQLKKALNKYRIFETLIIGIFQIAICFYYLKFIIVEAFCDSHDEIPETLKEVKKLIRNSHNNFNKIRRRRAHTS